MRCVRRVAPVAMATGAGPSAGRESTGEARCRTRESGSGVRAGTRTGAAALQRASLVLAHGTPHTGVLARVERPLQARLGHGAAAAHLLSLFDLHERRAGIA